MKTIHALFILLVSLELTSAQTVVTNPAYSPAKAASSQINANSSAADKKSLRTSLGVTESQTNLIQAGICISSTTDGTVTNVFTTAFSAAPNVTITQLSAKNTATNCIVSITATQFIAATGAATVTNEWVAVGPP